MVGRQRMDKSERLGPIWCLNEWNVRNRTMSNLFSILGVQNLVAQILSEEW